MFHFLTSKNEFINKAIISTYYKKTIEGNTDFLGE